jgi:hypothetical protein
MQAIRQQLLDKGGTLGDWGGLITNWLQPDDQLWTEGKTFPGDVLGQARAIMSKGAILEYECVDNRGREQGLALVRLLDWEDHAQGILKAEHLVASDGYYEWYAPRNSRKEKGCIISAALVGGNAVSALDVAIAGSWCTCTNGG